MGVAILVAEQEEISRASLSDLLRYEGYRVIEAGVSADAIGCISSNPDLRVILLDIEMAGCGLVVESVQRMAQPAHIIGMARESFHPIPVPDAVHSMFMKPLIFKEIAQEISQLLNDSPNHSR